MGEIKVNDVGPKENTSHPSSKCVGVNEKLVNDAEYCVQLKVQDHRYCT